MVFVSDTGSQQKRAQGNDGSGVSVEQKQPGYLAAYAQLWPTPAEGWRLHHEHTEGVLQSMPLSLLIQLVQAEQTLIPLLVEMKVCCITGAQLFQVVGCDDREETALMYDPDLSHLNMSRRLAANDANGPNSVNNSDRADSVDPGVNREGDATSPGPTNALD
ncbi:hypothetical protein EYF80_021703 [Liparis tanakae]|uniref:Uncharacterized protein n=1 Tax=Liparis tanakae TaxID=230148 RepID=A0A4Z2HQN0_9TELE|nr:hypothetical protein EYF80_021703 [Liparis tanakae]